MCSFIRFIAIFSKPLWDDPEQDDSSTTGTHQEARKELTRTEKERLWKAEETGDFLSLNLYKLITQ
jgi:gas vesicle GvpC-like protein